MFKIKRAHRKLANFPYYAAHHIFYIAVLIFCIFTPSSNVYAATLNLKFSGKSSQAILRSSHSVDSQTEKNIFGADIEFVMLITGNKSIAEALQSKTDSRILSISVKIDDRIRDTLTYDLITDKPTKTDRLHIDSEQNSSLVYYAFNRLYETGNYGYSKKIDLTLKPDTDFKEKNQLGIEFYVSSTDENFFSNNSYTPNIQFVASTSANILLNGLRVGSMQSLLPPFLVNDNNFLFQQVVFDLEAPFVIQSKKRMDNTEDNLAIPSPVPLPKSIWLFSFCSLSLLWLVDKKKLNHYPTTPAV